MSRRPLTEDCHHILNDRISWMSRPEARKLRQTPSLIPRIERPLHEQIHIDLPIVPLLGYHALQRTLATFEPASSTIKSIDNLAFAIESAIKHPRTHPIERDLGELTIEAVMLQREYLIGNIL